MAFHHRVLACCFRMIFSENRTTLFRIKRWAPVNGVFGAAAEPLGGHFGLTRKSRLALRDRGFSTT
jgi:hypothetical protein